MSDTDNTRLLELEDKLRELLDDYQTVSATLIFIDDENGETLIAGNGCALCACEALAVTIIEKHLTHLGHIDSRIH